MLLTCLIKNLVEDFKSNIGQYALLSGLLVLPSSCSCQTDTFFSGYQLQKGFGITVDILVRLVEDDQLIALHLDIQVGVVHNFILALSQEPEVFEVCFILFQ